MLGILLFLLVAAQVVTVVVVQLVLLRNTMRTLSLLVVQKYRKVMHLQKESYRDYLEIQK